MDKWTFGEIHEHDKNYADGTVVPSRSQKVYLNGLAIGEIEIHMHKRKGRDGKVDVSFGITTIVYGLAPGGN